MLNDATGFSHVYLACGYTDLRRGIDGLVSLVKYSFWLDPCEKGSLFLFCGRCTDRIKALVYEGDVFLLLYKRLADGRFQWPRTRDEVRQLNPQQYRWLMEGLCIQEMTQRESNLLNIRWLCKVAGVSRSGYYYWLSTAKECQLRDEQEKKTLRLSWMLTNIAVTTREHVAFTCACCT